jgi:(p)ppGpp synthase/HD superfamily hydrolase
MANNDSPQLGKRFEEALILANQLHAGQMRKGSNTPYISHLLSTAALVLQDGGDEDEAIAALLHDAVEDQGGEETLALIHDKFGEKIANIVDECSDTYETPKPPFRKRKENHIARLQKASPATCRVMLADKLHNARSLLHSLRDQGEAAWEISSGGKEGMLWYYRTLHEILGKRNQGYLWQEFGRVLEEIERLAEIG